MNTPEAATRQPGKMRPHALCGANELAPSSLTACPICGKPRPKNRTWSTYCSPRCRKAAHRIRRQNEIPADIRATLSRIEAKLDQILSKKEK